LLELALAEVVERGGGHLGFDGDPRAQLRIQVDPARRGSPTMRVESSSSGTTVRASFPT
jgi:hypothetical protein